jgi:hypothetical protein
VYDEATPSGQFAFDEQTTTETGAQQILQTGIEVLISKEAPYLHVCWISLWGLSYSEDSTRM